MDHVGSEGSARADGAGFRIFGVRFQRKLQKVLSCRSSDHGFAEIFYLNQLFRISRLSPAGDGE